MAVVEAELYALDEDAAHLLRAPDAASRDKLLAKLHEQLAVVSSIDGLGLWSWDAASDGVWASPQARSILGFDEYALLTRDILLAAVHPADLPRALQAIGSTTRTSELVQLQVRVAGRGGEIRWITGKFAASRDSKGALLRVTGCVIDDSKRRAAEEELAQQQRQITHLTRVAMLGELSGALAHELQQPLTAILCNAQAAQMLAAKSSLDVAELREILQDIVTDDKHAGQIIHQLRALLMRGEMHFHRHKIADLLDGVLILARGTLAERKIEVDTHIEEGVPAILGDRVELQQVLLNLVLNASESMSQNAAGDRRIELTAAFDPEHGGVRTSVLDRGTGIDSERLERVFDPFVTTKEGGLGLGLAVCRSIITAHRGQLWAENRSDRGAAFHFVLPVAAVEERQ
jgi:C4-dicarboxylate-specific signal transduction histidine kinase